MLGAANAGGDWAWRELYRTFAPPLDGYLRLRGVPDADDSGGETFLRVVRHLERFEGDEAAFRSWLFTIARNLVVDAARMRDRRPSDATPTPALQSIGPAAAFEDDTVGTLGTAEAIRALTGLTDDQRDVLLLRIVADLSIAQVAEVLGRREGAVKMLQARALATIRKDISLERVTP
jgi:RNA polymerase sigma-70 factor (ECF subfamily)